MQARFGQITCTSVYFVKSLTTQRKQYFREPPEKELTPLQCG